MPAVFLFLLCLRGDAQRTAKLGGIARGHKHDCSTGQGIDGDSSARACGFPLSYFSVCCHVVSHCLRAFSS